LPVKPQYIDFIPKVFSGTIRDLLKTTDERQKLSEIVPVLKLDAILDHQINTLSGGELQRVAIAACLARDADLYFLDEITAVPGHLPAHFGCKTDPGTCLPNARW